ncbi:MAG: alpha-ketoglutarate-dependent dioxygenase AlkB [Burkholderiales bacterium]
MNPEQTGLFADPPPLPEGFIYRPEFLSAQDERALLSAIGELPLDEAKYKEYTARRRVAYFGHDYDFSKNRLGDAPPIPPFLEPLRQKMARWMGLAPHELVTALIAEYRPGTPLGWHRDAPDYERVAGVSLGGWARMRLRPYRTNEPPGKDKPLVLELAPRSAYQMHGVARWGWQHSITATKELRYSITWRTLRRKN